MRPFRTYGAARGAQGNLRPYRIPYCRSHQHSPRQPAWRRKVGVAAARNGTNSLAFLRQGQRAAVQERGVCPRPLFRIPDRRR